jgi:hypothetical protein
MAILWHMDTMIMCGQFGAKSFQRIYRCGAGVRAEGLPR